MRSTILVITLAGLPFLAACTVNNTPDKPDTTVVTQPQPSATVVTPPPRTTVVTPSY